MVEKSKAVVPYLRQFTEEEKQLLKALLMQVAPKASNDEKRMFLYAAQKKGLDPFDKQIYLVPRWDNESKSYKHAVQVSIDGLRLMAQRSGKYAGQIGPQWCGKDRVWYDVWVEDEAPVAARVGILRHDFKEPLYSVALFESYKQTKKDGGLNIFWQKYGPHMLGKAAEALSIRRAFPEETSGYYIPEEMGNPEAVYVAEVEQDNDAPVAESEVVPESANPQQLAAIRKLYEQLGKPEPEGLADMGFADAKQLITDLAQEYKKREAMKVKLNALYDRGKLKGLWKNMDGVYPYASAALGFNVTKQSIYDLTDEHLAHLNDLIDAEPEKKAG